MEQTQETKPLAIDTPPTKLWTPQEIATINNYVPRYILLSRNEEKAGIMRDLVISFRQAGSVRTDAAIKSMLSQLSKKHIRDIATKLAKIQAEGLNTILPTQEELQERDDKEFDKTPTIPVIDTPISDVIDAPNPAKIVQEFPAIKLDKQLFKLLKLNEQAPIKLYYINGVYYQVDMID